MPHIKKPHIDLFIKDLKDIIKDLGKNYSNKN